MAWHVKKSSLDLQKEPHILNSAHIVFSKKLTNWLSTQCLECCSEYFNKMFRHLFIITNFHSPHQIKKNGMRSIGMHKKKPILFEWRNGKRALAGHIQQHTTQIEIQHEQLARFWIIPSRRNLFDSTGHNSQVHSKSLLHLWQVKQLTKGKKRERFQTSSRPKY